MPPAKRPAAKAKQALTEEQKQEIREAFDLFDTDGSGALRASAPTMSCGVPPRSRARTLRAPRRTVCHRYDRRQGAEGASTSSNYPPSRRRERPHPAPTIAPSRPLGAPPPLTHRHALHRPQRRLSRPRLAMPCGTVPRLCRSPPCARRVRRAHSTPPHPRSRCARLGSSRRKKRSRR